MSLVGMFVWKQLYQDKVLKQVFSQSHFLGLKRQNSKTEYQNVRFKSTSTPGEGLHLETAIWGLSKRDTLDIGEVRMPNGKVTSHVQNFGEDAMFVGSNGWTQVIGVADGVGGWIERGVDPSVFPLALMSACKAFVDSDHFTPNDAVALLAAGYSNVKNDKNNPVGSSTACILIYDNAASRLYAANLGDSGFLVARNGKIVHRSKDQQHFFNAPYQLAFLPQNDRSSSIENVAEDADSWSSDLILGDIVLSATDGLFDNMYDDVIMEELKSLNKKDDFESIRKTTRSLGEKTRMLSKDKRYLSPFAKGYTKEGYHSLGGKEDDITITLSVVTKKK